MKKFCKSLGEHAMRLSILNEEQESYENTKMCYIC